MCKFLQALPPKFDQIVASIETLLDLSEVSVDELVGRFKAAEERLVQDKIDTLPRLNLTEDELIAKITSRLKIAGGSGSQKGSSSSGGKRGHGRGCGCGKNSGGRASNDGSNVGRGGNSAAGDECRYYGKRGH
jgi:hypothetical protein